MRTDFSLSSFAKSFAAPGPSQAGSGGSSRRFRKTGIRFEERVKQLLPAAFYYPRKIAKEARKHEPELAGLHEIVPAARVAVDVGANRGYYSYALSKIAGRVEAFEPNPDLAHFAAGKLPPNVRLHQVALSDRQGRGTLYIPRTERATSLHLLASLGRVHQAAHEDEVEVPLATLDSYRYGDVGFIKIDAEGSEMDIVEGASETISRCRPIMLIELLAGTYTDPLAHIADVQRRFRYEARIRVGERYLGVSQALETGAILMTRNVLFLPG